MTTWKFIATREAERDGWIVDYGNGMLLGENEDGSLTAVQAEEEGTWMVSEYGKDFCYELDHFGIDWETVKSIVGNDELLNLLVCDIEQLHATNRHKATVTYKGDKDNPKKGDRRVFNFGTHLHTEAYDPERGWMDNEEYNWLHRWDFLYE